MKYTYIPEGVCSRKIELEVEEGIIKKLNVIGGCDGNLKGITKLVEGMKVEEVIEKLKGVDCRRKRNVMPRSNSKGIRKHICKYIITLYLEYKVPKSDRYLKRIS